MRKHPELVSTRDVNYEYVDFGQALLEVLAPDGGLYSPPELGLPFLNTRMLEGLKNLPYASIAGHINSLLVGGSIPTGVNERLARQAFSLANFPNTERGNVMPVTRPFEGLFMQDLSGGPTAAFKDAALQFVPLQMDYLLGLKGENMTILNATSGDTGSAAQDGVMKTDHLSIVTLSPYEGTMTSMQRAMMAQRSGERVHNISVKGNFDDCQDLVKMFSEGYGALNSINIGRIYAQIPYSFSGYFQTIALNPDLRIGDQIDVTVPTGNFGNALSVHYARLMGLPIRNIIIATNENSVLDDLVQTGIYSRRAVKNTSSPSMDIAKSSNLERLIWLLLSQDTADTDGFMDMFEKTGEVLLSQFGVAANALINLNFKSGTSTEDDRLATIKSTYFNSGSVIDPHTADGVKVGLESMDTVPMLVLSTAKPVKFEETIKEALGFVPKREERFANLDDWDPQAFTVIDNDPDQLSDYLAKI